MRKLFLSFLALSAITCYTSNANAVVIKQPKHLASQRIEKDVGIIDIIGEINDDTANVVHKGFQNFKKHDIKQVIIHLDSLGGSLTDGTFVINDMLDAEQHGINVVTLVDHKEFCASMCTGIYAVGSDRMAPRDTLWIFHAPYVKLTPEEQKDPKITEEVNQQLKQAQDYMLELYRSADPDWTDKVLKDHITQPGNDLIITGGDIIDQKSTWILIEIQD